MNYDSYLMSVISYVFMRAQTATEYLYILAAVLILALIGISVVASVGKVTPQSQQRSEQLYWAQQPIGIISWAANQEGAQLVLRNNNQRLVTIQSVSINGHTRTINRSIAPDGTLTVFHLGVSESTPYAHSVIINYTDRITQMNILQQSDQLLSAEPSAGTLLLYKEPLIQGLSAWWRFNNDFYDLTGNYSFDTYPDTYEFIEGKVGKGLEITKTAVSTTPYLEFTNKPVLGAHNFTVVTWLKIDDTNNREIFSENLQSGLGGAHITGGVWLYGRIYIRVYYDNLWGFCGDFDITTDEVYTDNTWHHFGFQRNGGYLHIYHNGQHLISNAIEQTCDYPGVSEFFRIGGLTGSPDTSLQIDEFMVFTRPLSEPEIYSIYEMTHPRE